MIIRPAGSADMESIRRLYNAITTEPQIFYKPLSPEDFERIFASPGRTIICTIENGDVAGFAAGTSVPDMNCAYITYVGTSPEHRRRGVGTAALATLEEKLMSDREINKIEIVFRNPACLPWFIPDGSGADHPCAPGVDITSSAYNFFKKTC